MRSAARTADNSISLEALEGSGMSEMRQAATLDDPPVFGLDPVLRKVDELLDP